MIVCETKVIGAGTALVDGKNTGLAGCNTPCGRENCMRKDTRLKFFHDLGEAGSCRRFILATNTETPA